MADTTLRLHLFRSTLFWLGGLGLLLFVAAGRIDWWPGWTFIAEIAVCTLALGLWLARHDPALLAERLRPLVRRDQLGWDRVVMAAALPAWTAWFIFMALDAGRFGWSAPMPGWLAFAGAALIALGYLVVWRTFRANSFAAPVVAIQTERAHHVISTGPYARVRHPMYAGALLFFLGAPLLFGSWWGLALAVPMAGILAFRAVLEERTLVAGLAGYADYAARVRWRLLPGVW